MNSVHNVLCPSGWWARRAEFELIPFGLKGVDPGDDVLEIGPGFGATAAGMSGPTVKVGGRSFRWRATRS